MEFVTSGAQSLSQRAASDEGVSVAIATTSRQERIIEAGLVLDAGHLWQRKFGAELERRP